MVIGVVGVVLQRVVLLAVLELILE